MEFVHRWIRLNSNFARRLRICTTLLSLDGSSKTSMDQTRDIAPHISLFSFISFCALLFRLLVGTICALYWESLFDYNQAIFLVWTTYDFSPLLWEIFYVKIWVSLVCLCACVVAPPLFFQVRGILIPPHITLFLFIHSPSKYTSYIFKQEKGVCVMIRMEPSKSVFTRVQLA